jgi:flagellar basal body-associated protein FliL
MYNKDKIMKDLIIRVLMAVIIIACIASMGYGCFMVKRTINYKIGYESMVQKQVNDAMAKHIKDYHTNK